MSIDKLPTQPLDELFVGRDDELRLWKEVLAQPQGQAVLVVGQQGMGKTMLANRMAESMMNHPTLKCGYVRYEVAESDGVEGTMALMLDHAFEAAQAEAGSLDSIPQRSRQWQALINLLPKGKELSDLVGSLRRDVQRSTREQLVQRLQLISDRMPENGRAVFVLDPEKYIPEGSTDAWRLVVRELPDKIKFIFAQRNDGRLIADENFCSLEQVVRIPDGELDALSESGVEELLDLFFPKIKGPLPGEVRRVIAPYNRHPYAVPAALAMLADGMPIEDLPADPTKENIAAAQWRQVCQHGKEAIRLFRAYALLEVAVPNEVVQATADLDSETYQSLLAHDYLRGLLREESDGRRIYHSLLADHVAQSVSETDALPYHQRAVQTYRTRLTANDKPDVLAAIRLCEHVLKAEGEGAFVETLVNDCTRSLHTLGLLDAFIELYDRALFFSNEKSAQKAALLSNFAIVHQTRGDLDLAETMLLEAHEVNETLEQAEEMAGTYGNLALIYRTRGDLQQAETMFRQALEINIRFNNLQGMANQYGNLALIYMTRNELDQAETMLYTALEINNKLKRLQEVASQYSNLGVLYQTRGDLDQSETMHRQALEINEKLEHIEGMAINYGNLGINHQLRGDLEQAETLFRQALDIEERLNRKEGMANQYGSLGSIYRARGDLEQAERMYRRALEINEKLSRRVGMAKQYGNLGVIAVDRKNYHEAEKLWRKALELFTQIGATLEIEQTQANLDNLPPPEGDES